MTSTLPRQRQGTGACIPTPPGLTLRDELMREVGRQYRENKLHELQERTNHKYLSDFKLELGSSGSFNLCALAFQRGNALYFLTEDLHCYREWKKKIRMNNIAPQLSEGFANDSLTRFANLSHHLHERMSES